MGIIAEIVLVVDLGWEKCFKLTILSPFQPFTMQDSEPNLRFKILAIDRSSKCSNFAN